MAKKIVFSGLPVDYRGIGLGKEEQQRVIRLEQAIASRRLHPHAIYDGRSRPRVLRIMEGKE